MNDFISRLMMRLGGYACVGCEVWGTYDYLWDKHAHWNYLVVGGLVLTTLAAVLPEAAEHARRQGRHGLKILLWLAIPVALAFVFTVSIQRTGGVTDTDETARKQLAEGIRIAKKEEREAEAQLVTDKAAVKANCDVWRTICQKAKDAQAATEKKLTDARAVLKKQGVEVDDSMAKRIVAYLPWITKEQVLLYQPLLLPLGLAIIGSLLIAAGARGKAPEPKPGWRARWRARRMAAQQTRSENVSAKARMIDISPKPALPAPKATDEIDPSPVVDFMKRRLRASRGEAADWGEIYGAFLADWEEQGHDDEPVNAAQFGHVLRYICEKANIRIERRGKTVVCVDRKLVA